MFIAFALTRSIKDNVASKFLIALDAFVGVFAVFECLQTIVCASEYFKDIWNYLYMLLISILVIIWILFWTGSNVEALTFFDCLSFVVYRNATCCPNY